MITLCREVSWYRPYTVNINGKKYLLEDIKFYDENGVIVTTGGGWAQTVNGIDMTELIINTDKVIRRNKEKFDGEVFGIIVKCSYYNESRINLYIPAKLVNSKYVGKKKMHGNNVYDVYQGDHSLQCTKFVASLDTAMHEIQNCYSTLLERVSTYELQFHTEQIKDRLLQMIGLVDTYIEEKAKVDNIIVE
jgi:hypothetical protein